MIEDLEICYWPFARLHEGLELLARESGLAVEHVQLHAPQLTEPPQSDQLIRQSIEGLAHRLGLEAEPVQLTYKQVEEFLHSAGPAILSVSGRERISFLVLLKSKQNRLSFIGTDSIVYQTAVEPVRSALCHEVEAPVLTELDGLLQEIGIPVRQRNRSRGYRKFCRIRKPCRDLPHKHIKPDLGKKCKEFRSWIAL